VIDWQPILEQLAGGIVANDTPSHLPVVPRDNEAGLGIVGGPAASNQALPPRLCSCTPPTTR